MLGDLSSVVGESLPGERRRRPELRRQEDVARAMWARGLDWSRDTVASLESGRRRVTLDEFVALCDVFGKAPWQWFLHDDSLKPVRLTLEGSPGPHLWPEAVGPSSPPPFTGDPAEAKAAKVLGVEPDVVRKAARALWGRSLSEERDARASEKEPKAAGRRLQALRGHATRDMLIQLRRVLKT